MLCRKEVSGFWIGTSFLTGSNLNIVSTSIAVPLLLATCSACIGIVNGIVNAQGGRRR